MSISFYSVVQYIPNVMTNERMNVAVVTCDESGNSLGRMLNDWNRVKHLVGGNTNLIEQRVAEVIGLQFSVQDLHHRAEHCNESIQFSQPSASTLDVERLLNDIAGTMLVDKENSRHDRPKTRATKLAHSEMSAAMALHPKLSLAHFKLGRLKAVDGRSLDGLRVDLAITNGSLRVGVMCASFEATSPQRAFEERIVTQSVLLDLSQIETAPTPSLAAVIVPPGSRSSLKIQNEYEALTSELRDISKLAILSESSVAEWSREIVENLANSIAV